jgi:hypothetical protein
VLAFAVAVIVGVVLANGVNNPPDDSGSGQQVKEEASAGKKEERRKEDDSAEPAKDDAKAPPPDEKGSAKGVGKDPSKDDGPPKLEEKAPSKGDASPKPAEKVPSEDDAAPKPAKKEPGGDEVALKPGGPETAGEKLAAALLQAKGEKREALIQNYQKTKGSDYTEALARVASRVAGKERAKVRGALADRMARMNDKTLSRYLRDENPEIRHAAVLGVAWRDSMAHVQRMIEMLDDPEVLVVRATVASLKSLSGKDYGPRQYATQTEHDEAVARWKDWARKSAASKEGEQAQQKVDAAEQTKKKVGKILVKTDRQPDQAAKVREIPDLLYLMEKGIVEARIVQVTMNRVDVQVKPKEKTATFVSVPAGTLFRSGNRSYQDLVVVETLEVRLTGQDPLTVQLKTCCTDIRKACPRDTDYRMERLPENDKIRKLAEQLSKSPLSIRQKQAAVWKLGSELNAGK